jgi:adenine-specific DNA-methyltransferase
MRKLTVDDPTTRSADLVADNVAKLKALIPEAFTEGKIDFDVLKQVLGGAVDEREEKYGLHWHEKRRARQLALTPSTGTLRPCREESVDWDTTQNLFIEGDNLEVLKLLQKSYAGKVKLIYIDPPYNTGNDFVYPDDFQDNLKNYLALTGQVEGGRRITSNTEASGRFHTDWLNMMYPRLKLARNLLREDGLIFISIDDNENAHLRLILDEVFGPENFVANIVWEKAYTANMTARFISSTHDHLLVFARNAERTRLGRFARTEDQKAKFKNPDNDPRGPWKAENLSAGKYYSAGQFEIEGPTGKKFLPPPGRYWRCNEEQYTEWLRDNRITFGQSGDGRPMLKKFLSEVEEGLTPSTWWGHTEFGTNKEASLELKELFAGEASFQTPKPIKLLSRICELATSENDIVLDFFAGSGTTGHACLQVSAVQEAQRRFILVQLPEPLDERNPDQKVGAEVCKKLGHPPLLSELTKERLRRAGSSVSTQFPDWTGDVGFRVFKLDSSNIRTWEPDRDALKDSLFASLEHIREGRSPDDILYEVLLKLGLDLCVPIEQRTIAGKTVHSIGGGVLMVCLEEKIARRDVEQLALGMAEWNKTLAPIGETTCVFRDSAFADDVAKSNLAALLEQHGLSKVTSL